MSPRLILLKASAKCTTDDTRCEQCFCFVFHCSWFISIPCAIHFTRYEWLNRFTAISLNTFYWSMAVVILSYDSSMCRFICSWNVTRISTNEQVPLNLHHAEILVPIWWLQSWKWNVQNFSFSLNAEQVSKQTSVCHSSIHHEHEMRA